MTGQRNSPIRNPKTAQRDADDGLGFARDSRLLKHADFQKVYENGRRHFSANMTFFYLLRPNSDSPRGHIGFTVGRVMGGAVVRNRIKRRLRDAVRHHLPALDHALKSRTLSGEIVINPKKGALKAEVETLRSEVAKGFQVIAAAQPGPQAAEAAAKLPRARKARTKKAKP